MKKEKIAKILVPCLILLIIGGIYFFKNPSVQNQEPEDAVTPEDAAFALNETEPIDFNALAEYGLPVIVDYGSDSCLPCQQMAPVLETMNQEMSGKAFIKFVDVWKNAGAASNVPVQVIPTQVLVNADGTPFVPSEELAQTMEFILYSSRETGDHVFTVHQGGMTEEQMRLILTEMGVES